MSRAAGPQCQHVRGMPWSLCLTGGTSVSGALCLGMDQGAWCRWTVRVACLWPLGAGSRMVGGVQPSADGVGSSCVVPPSLGVSCSLGRGRGCWRCKAVYAVSMSLGPGMSRPAFVAHARRYAWKTWRAGHCGSERNGAWWASHWAMIFICVGVIYTMVTVAPTRRRVSTSPAGCRWMSVCVATSGPC